MEFISVKTYFGQFQYRIGGAKKALWERWALRKGFMEMKQHCTDIVDGTVTKIGQSHLWEQEIFNKMKEQGRDISGYERRREMLMYYSEWDF